MNWKQQILQLREAYFQKKFPSLSKDHGIPAANPYYDDTSNHLTRSIIDWIKFSGGAATRINTQGQLRKVNGRQIWTKGSTRKGTADIIGTYKGRYLAIEVKMGYDKLSQAQQDEKRSIESAGGLYFVANNFTEFLEWWKIKVECLKNFEIV